VTPSSANIKIGLVATAIVVVLGILWYTNIIVGRLQESERRVVNLFAKTLEYNTNASDKDVGNYTFFLDNILSVIDFPLIQSDPHNVPDSPYVFFTRNIDRDTTKSPAEQKQYLQDRINAFDKQYPPIRVSYINPDTHDTTVLNYLHYGDSPLISRLQWLPYIEIAVGALFIIIGYIGFSNIKRAEQSSIWAGMARETAHQLGTPLSSLMGWSELLSDKLAYTPAGDIVRELRSDIERLQKVADRFGKIGSRPALRPESLNGVVQNVVTYLERRIPQMNKKVTIAVHNTAQLRVPLNAELFEWVIENLLKNALDAIESKGAINVTIGLVGNLAIVEVQDSGKGIDIRNKKDVFRPGFSTKRRGWGLGLSLSKRIVEEFHKGKIFVKTTAAGKGTTFRIELHVS